VVAAARVARALSFFHPMETNPGRSPGVQNAGVVMYYRLLPFAPYGVVTLPRRRVSTWPILAVDAFLSRIRERQRDGPVPVPA
jgi:hypothetical protein